MPRVNKRKEVENFVLVYEEKHGHLPTRDTVVEELKVGNGTADIILVPLRNSRMKIVKDMNPIQFSKAQRTHVETAINIARKALERDFESRVRYQISLYIQKHFPNLETRQTELNRKIEMYDKMINKHKAILTTDEFKAILMCLHPDGERTKEKLEETFILFKSREDQLTKK